MEMYLRKYGPLWSKYRPVILKMLLAAAQEPQQYKFTPHEFKAMDEKKKTGYGFALFYRNAKRLTALRSRKQLKTC
jgi:hypothetical protein